MASKILNARLVQKNDTSENWAKATNFTPLKGEIIVYTDLGKIKIGDGSTKVGSLDFANAKDAETLMGASLSTVLNDSEVEIPTSKAVRNYVEEKADKSHTHDDRYYTETEVDSALSNKQDKIFWATYGTTTLDEMKTAYDAGKDVKCLRGSVIYTLYGCVDSGAYFFYSRSDSLYVVTCSSENLWKSYSKTIPTKTSQLTNDSNFITFTNLATVATSGSYKDLKDQPLIVNFINYESNTFGVDEQYFYYNAAAFNTLANSLALI